MWSNLQGHFTSVLTSSQIHTMPVMLTEQERPLHEPACSHYVAYTDIVSPPSLTKA